MKNSKKDFFEIPEELKLFAIWQENNNEKKNEKFFALKDENSLEIGTRINLECTACCSCCSSCMCGCPGGLHPDIVRSIIKKLDEKINGDQ